MKQPEDTKTRDLLAKTCRGPYAKLPGPRQRTFGDFIVMRRQLRHMTQVQYAGALNISRRSLISAEQLREVPRWAYKGPIWEFARYEFREWMSMIWAFTKWAEAETRNVQISEPGLAVCTFGQPA